MSEGEVEYQYWRHTWKGTCHRSEKGKGWGVTIWEEITWDEYEEWVWERRKIWMWDKEIAYQELGLELL